MKRKIYSGVNKLQSAVALLTAELVFLFIVFVVSLTSLMMIIRLIFFSQDEGIDHKVFDFLLPYITDTNTSIMLFITFLGSYAFMVPAWLLLFAYNLFIRKNKWYFIVTVIIAVSNLAMMRGLKYFFNRPRPLIPLLKEVPGLSFPSGHAYMGVIFYGLLIYFVYNDVRNNFLKWLLISTLAILAFLVGFSRVYLRVHYASDVLAGFCFGVLSLLILLWLLKRIKKYNAQKMTPDLNKAITGEAS